jgi:uncharacterized protein (DUF1778 family)
VKQIHRLIVERHNEMIKSKAILLRLDPKTFDLLAMLAKEAGENKSYVLRALVQDAAEQIGEDCPRLVFNQNTPSFDRAEAKEAV